MRRTWLADAGGGGVGVGVHMGNIRKNVGSLWEQRLAPGDTQQRNRDLGPTTMKN